jgi:ribosomal protein L11 methyltransferase
MYSLDLTCPAGSSELISAELWERGTIGIREIDGLSGTQLIACFETNEARESLLVQFAAYSPHWKQEDVTDWVLVAQESWPAREVGRRFFVAPPWNQEPTPAGRIRLIQNPGLACGTGDHPCTQLALIALENAVNAKARVADIGSGSGILTIGATLLGARFAVGVDADESASAAALQNFALNGLEPAIFTGSADCLATGAFDVVAANISSTVVLAIFDEILRIAKPGATVILTGFSTAEAKTFEPLIAATWVAEMGDWACVAGTAPGTS